MTIRFLQTTPSAKPGFPFQPGQVITLTGMTREARQWLKDGRVEVVKEVPEAAVAGVSERAVMPRAKGRHADRTAV